MRCTVLFFKQKTAYEMRIRDGSSDVCSSDLGAPEEILDAMNQLSAQVLRAGEILGWVRSFVKKRPPQTTALDINALVRETVGLVSYERCNQDFSIELALARSEERRGGKECVGTGRSRWSTSH